MQKIWQHTQNILNKTSTKFLCMAVGVIIGLFFPQAVSKLSPIYTYFNLILKSILLVMLPLAIISNVTSSLIKGVSAKFIGRIIAVLVAVVFIHIMVVMVCGFIYSNVYKANYEDRKSIGQLMEDSLSSGFSIPSETNEEKQVEDEDNVGVTVQKVSFNGESEKRLEVNLDFFTDKFITKNIFLSLSAERNLQVIVFFIIISVCFQAASKAALVQMTKISKSLYSMLYNMLNVVITMLPIVLLVSMAQIVSVINISMLKSMWSLILCIWLTHLFITMLCIFVVRLKTGFAVTKQLKIMKPALIIAALTGSQDVYISKLFEVCKNGFKFEETKSDCVLSLAYALTAFGRNVTFVMLTFFAIKLYDVKMSLWFLISIPFITFLATISGINKVDRIAASYIYLLLTPLGIPYLPFVIIQEVIWNTIFPVESCSIAYLYVVCVSLSLTGKANATTLLKDYKKLKEQIQPKILQRGEQYD